VVSRGWIDLLSELGVSHLYLSPVFEATQGSTHGYDVVDHSVVDPALGGDAALGRLASAAHDAGLGVVVDLVPNHMAADPAGNRLWWDVLRNGRSSPHADLFDIDWAVPELRLRGQILLPVLGEPSGREIESGRFSAGVTEHGEPVINHPSITAPLELSSLTAVLAEVAGALSSAELGDLATECGRLPHHDVDDSELRLARASTECDLRMRLQSLLVSNDGLAEGVRTRLSQVASDPTTLDALLEAQPYRLSKWQAGLEDLGYRRFFDITALVALRAERQLTFDVTHSGLARWIAHGWVDGVRVDHVDGLSDPLQYLTRLRALVGDRPIWVEKILASGESLPSEWPVSGTTGYEVAERVARLDMDDQGRPVLERLAERAGAPTEVEENAAACVRLVLEQLLAADVNRLVELTLRICDERRRLRDTTRREVRELLLDLAAHLHQYRTYVVPGEALRDADAMALASAVDAVTDTGRHDPDLVEFLHQVLRGETISEVEPEVCIRFQQLTGPARAKGCEDTAWYRLVALASRCEVGSEPDDWGMELEDFHEWMGRRQRDWPHALSTASTHDSKRSADARARLDALSQMAAPMERLVHRWWERVGLGDDPALDLAMIQMIFAIPGLDDRRLGIWALKAARETKSLTSWLTPDAKYEERLAARASAMLSDQILATALRDLDLQLAELARNLILTRVAIGLTVPGVPDIYQGSETWKYTLVDPDNRVPVDPSPSTATCATLGSPHETIRVAPDHVSAKLALTRACLALRRSHPASFAEHASYRPLWSTGPRSDHVVAFARGEDVVIVSQRLASRLTDGWKATELTLPDGVWRNRCGDGTLNGTIEVAELLKTWPVALLERG